MVRNILQFYLTIGIPLFYIFILVVMWNSPHTLSISSAWINMGLVLTFLGLVLWFLSYFYLGKSFGVLPKKQKRVRHGVYRYIPHPMYVGISTTFIGLSMAYRSYPGLVITILFLIPLLILRALMEERKLTKV